MTGPGDGDIGEAGVEQVRVNAGVGVNENAFCGEALSAVASDGVPVIEMPVLGGVEVNPSVVIEPGGDAAVERNGFNDGKVPVGDSERFVRGSELDAIADGECAVAFSIDADACKATGIVSGEFSVGFLDREMVLRWVDCCDGCVATRLDPNGFAAAGIAHDVSDFVVTRPCAFGAGHVLALSENPDGMVLRRKCSIGLQLLANGDVQFAA